MNWPPAAEPAGACVWPASSSIRSSQSGVDVCARDIVACVISPRTSSTGWWADRWGLSAGADEVAAWRLAVLDPVQVRARPNPIPVVEPLRCGALRPVGRQVLDQVVVQLSERRPLPGALAVQPVVLELLTPRVGVDAGRAPLRARMRQPARRADHHPSSDGFRTMISNSSSEPNPVVGTAAIRSTGMTSARTVRSPLSSRMVPRPVDHDVNGCLASPSTLTVPRYA